MSGSRLDITQVAKSTPFDNSTNGFVSTDVQSAIEEVHTLVENSFAPLNFGYNGTANANRWLEVISNNPTGPYPGSGTPFIIAGTHVIYALSLGCSGSNTGTITVYLNGSAITSISISSDSKAIVTGLSISLSPLDALTAQVTSGTISRPNLTVWI